MAKYAEVIKYEGDNSTFIWKHPAEDFSTMTQLIVHESQEAVFFMNGQALDLFGPGRHTLETQNIPLLSQVFHFITGDAPSPFHCEVYFINKTEEMAIKWGTDSRVQYIEPRYGFPLSIGASGEMNLRVEDARRLLIKVVGTESRLDRQSIVSFFRAFLMTRVKPYMARFMQSGSVSIFELDAHLDEFSGALQEQLKSDFSEYGISLERFFVLNIAKPDGEHQYERFKELHFRQYADVTEARIQQQTAIINAQTEAQKTVIESQALAQKRVQEGYTYQQERGFDVAAAMAQNEAAGQFANMGIGLGAMTGVGGAVGGFMGGVIGTAMEGAGVAAVQPAQSICPKCGAHVPPGSRFCQACGCNIQGAAPGICPQCRKPVPAGSRFCPHCGLALHGEDKA